jgi:2-polyprenyl-3-methyl-5-hydroxy-6-metoxy-1,4-benzoquinol methylase
MNNNKYFYLRNLKIDYYKNFQIPKYIENLLITNKIKSILDYGCGLGQLTTSLHNKKYNVMGMDTSNESLVELKKKKINFLKIKNLKTQKKKFKDKFDFIILNHVLEHQKKAEIISFLKDLKFMLKKNGLLFIAVPNAQALTGAYWRYEDFTHETIFTSGSLYYVLKASGFQHIKFIDIYATQNLNIITRTIRLFALKLIEIIHHIILKITGNGFHATSKNIFTYEIKCIAKKN